MQTFNQVIAFALMLVLISLMEVEARPQADMTASGSILASWGGDLPRGFFGRR